MIRQVKLTELSSVLPLCQAFSNEALAPFGLVYDEERVKRQLVRWVMDEDTLFLIGLLDEKVVGVLVAVMVPALTSGNAVVQEMIWYVDADHRGGTVGARLLFALEKWCVIRGASHLVMANMDDEGVERMYTKRAFKRMEVHYIKEI